MKKLISFCQAAAVLCFCAAIPAGAQDPAVVGTPLGSGSYPQTIFAMDEQDPIVGGAAPLALFSSDALDQLLRPIALYPDPLLAEVFTAATVPAQIVLADRYVNGGGDLSQIEAQPWDPSVQALAHYPTVLQWLDENLPWTTEVGDAFLNQQGDVMASIQRLRLMAENQGNLPQSTPQENVVTDSGTIEIEPANPDIIYVPVYTWNTIYYDPGIFCTFGVGFPIGRWLTHDWDWRNHRMIVWGAGHSRPANWWSLPARNRVAPSGVALWHAPVRATVGGAGGADRGFAVETSRTARLAAPSAPAPPGGRAGTVPGLGLSSGRAGTLPGVSSARPGTVPGFPSGIRSGPALSAGERPGVGLSSLPGISRPAPEVHVPSAGSSFGGGAFGGSESSSEARQSSVRGVESRSAISAPAAAPSFSSSSRPSPAASSASSSHTSSAPSGSSTPSRGR